MMKSKQPSMHLRKRHSALSWAIESLETRRLLHHQIDATFVPDNLTNPTAGHWVINAGAQADQNNESADAVPIGFVPGVAISSVALPGLPDLNSDPTAHAAIYLDFNGDAGGQTAYDEDGDPTSFNAAEVAHITAAWQSISTYFAPFDLNVTTTKPATAEPTAWGMIGNSISGGYSYVNVFPNVQRFGGPGSFNQSSDARTRTSGLAHEYGHNFGLSHQSDYNYLGVKTAEYSSGFNALHGPIMGVDFAQTVHKWFIGHSSNSNSTLQDDLAGISASIKSATGFSDGYRVDDYGNTIATATALTASGSVQSASGIIERASDADVFSFTSDGTQTLIDVNPTGPSGLAANVEVYDAAGNLLAAKDDTYRRSGINNNDETIPVLLPVGTYYVMVKSHGDYGDVGQYTITAQPLPLGFNSLDVGGPTLAGSAGYNVASDTYTLTASGSDIWGTNDQFQYAYQSLTGDGSITARIVSQDTTASFNKAGVMIRETTAGGSKEVMEILSPGNGLRLQYRNTTNGNSADAGGTGGVAAPYWVKLTRTGNTFTSASSTDGVTWTPERSITVAMNASVSIGLVVDSGNNSVINTTTFDNVTFTGNVSAAPTFNALPAPTGLTAVPGVGTGLTLNWSGVAGSNGFTVERSIDGTTWALAGVTAAGVTTYNDNSLFGSMRYFYRVSSNDASGKSVPSDPVSAINRPNAPFNLTTESISTSQIVLNWRDVSGETGYRIERSTDGVTYTQIATVGVNIPSYVDSGFSANTVRKYRVTALSTQGDSPISVVITASTRLATATGQSFVTVAPTQLAIQWTAIAGATNYRIERSTDNITFTSLATVGAVLTYSDTTVTPLNAYYYRVTGTNTLTEGFAPAAIFAASPATTALPSPWQSQDIGAIGGSGAAGFSAGTYTVIANGADIWGNADAFRYVYEPLNGDGSIIARVATQLNTDGYAKSGVMIRESTAAGSRQVMVQVTPGNGVHLQYRTATGGASTDVVGTAAVVAPYWVKLTRVGNVFAASSSINGTTWTAVGSVTIAMSANALVGLADTSHTTNTLNKSTFDNVTVSNNPPTVQTPASATPSPVLGTTTNLSVLGADDHGEANLTYTWSSTGPAAVTYTGVANGSNAAKNLTANFTRAGSYTFTCTISDGSLSVTSSTVVTVRSGSVVNRAIFYNNSFFDGTDVTANALDDNAIATDKSALLPSQTTTFANYTSYDKGINGIMVDVANLPASLATTADFDFQVSLDGSTWTPAPSAAIPSLLIRPGTGAGGSDRIEITFPDLSIRNQWLRVTLSANANTGLAAPDVFYFGNLVGCSGMHNNVGIVNNTDAIAARIQINTVATISSVLDYNRSGMVTNTDVITVRINNLHSLAYFTAPPPGPTAASVTAAVGRTAGNPALSVSKFSIIPILPTWMTGIAAKRKVLLLA